MVAPRGGLGSKVRKAEKAAKQANAHIAKIAESWGVDQLVICLIDQPRNGPLGFRR
jgi:hypothetical protein